MKAWLKWFRGLSGPSKWTIVGTLLSAIGLAYTVLPLPTLTGGPAQSGPGLDRPPAEPGQHVGGNGNVVVGSVREARDININAPPKPAFEDYLKGTEGVIVYREPLHRLLDDPKNRLCVARDGTLVTRIKDVKELANGHDFEDMFFNGANIVLWSKVKLEDGANKGVVGWVLTGAIDQR